MYKGIGVKVSWTEFREGWEMGQLEAIQEEISGMKINAGQVRHLLMQARLGMMPTVALQSCSECDHRASVDAVGSRPSFCAAVMNL